MAFRYLLDTDICSYIRRKQPPKVLAHLEKLEPGAVGISVITYGELAYGATRSVDARRSLTDLDRFIALIPVLSLPETAGKTYGIVRATLSARGGLIGANDLWIAAHALAGDLVLVTNNEREFRRVNELKVENWAK
jgi:tRNA(fMet)-specific endonuclease VapC